MGFDFGSTMEIILTTWNNDGTVNAAPMGIVRDIKDQIIIRPYKSSNTYRNMLRNNGRIINLTQDSEIFLKTAFKDENLGPYLIEDGKLSLDGSDAFIQVKIINFESENENRSTFTCSIQQIITKKRIPKRFQSRKK